MDIFFLKIDYCNFILQRANIINYTPICKKKQQDFRDFRRYSHLIYIR